jgi:hypothetical protein
LKVRIEIEVGPTELREFLGLPDVAGIQQEALESLVKKLRSGAATGSDAITVLRGMVPEGLTSLSEWQRLIGRALQTGRPVHVEAEATVEPGAPAEGSTGRRTSTRTATRASASRKKKRTGRNTTS